MADGLRGEGRKVGERVNSARDLQAFQARHRIPIPAHLAALARPNQTLLDFLRNTLHLTGSKLGCGEGGCGACTVLLSRFDKSKGAVVHSTNGVGSNNSGTANCSGEETDNLHPIQRALDRSHDQLRDLSGIASIDMLEALAPRVSFHF
eukprot:scaffold10629_cov77-Skeletonema_dohrnii-CCMP3373.AAC.5